MLLNVVHLPMVFLSAPELLNVRPTFCVVVHTPIGSDVQLPACAATICEALYHMFTTYGVCQTLISDRGSEFTNKCAAELCKLLEVTQEFTPAFAHHCLGRVNDNTERWPNV
jgi:hypothetical protein